MILLVDYGMSSSESVFDFIERIIEEYKTLQPDSIVMTTIGVEVAIYELLIDKNLPVVVVSLDQFKQIRQQEQVTVIRSIGGWVFL